MPQTSMQTIEIKDQTDVRYQALDVIHQVTWEGTTVTEVLVVSQEGEFELWPLPKFIKKFRLSR